MTVKHVDHLNLSVGDLDESADFYRRLFDFEEVERGEHKGTPWRILRSGDAMLCVYEHADFERVDADRRNTKGQHGINHFGLRIADKAEWETRLAREQVVVHQQWEYPHSTSWYVYDPTGYEIEVAYWHNDAITFG